MPCLIAAPMRSDLKGTTRQKNNQNISKNKNFMAKTEYINLKAKAHSNNVKMQSDKQIKT